ncbi:MAG: DUF924 family protein [Burkholderiaceae bacterium]
MNPQDVLDFWFGAPNSAEFGSARAVWFRKDSAFDQLIAQRFGDTVQAALGGGLHDWAESAAPGLARIVVLDQFTRNMFRDTPKAFAGDTLALRAAQAMIERGADAALLPVQRAFVYLPLEHAEDSATQARCVALFTTLAEQDASMRSMLDYAIRHHDVIQRFGRFPHRNAVLGRASTAEELAFLKEPGSSF